jgi:hypothetical protein
MTEFMYLHGTEKVQDAAHSIADAARLITQAAAHMDESLRLHRQWMDDWISRFEIIMNRRNDAE